MKPRAFSVLTTLVLALTLALPAVSPLPAAAGPGPAIAGGTFGNVWVRTDYPVATGAVSRTWMWGPIPGSLALQEPYAEAPGGMRLVQYYDKSRMELTHPDGDSTSPWYVTNGLLTKELITGRMQVGDNSFQQYAPAQVNVAGDANDPNGPTYATFTPLLGYGAIPNGWVIIQTLNRAGQIGADISLSSYNVSALDVGAPTSHTVASVFWDFMTGSGPVWSAGRLTTDALFLNPFYATGYPITEAYWTTVKVGGTPKQVLGQCFERRCLTYTPSNPAGWQVEAGNVGQHYYAWRYGQLGMQPVVASPLPPNYVPPSIGAHVAAYGGVSVDYDPALASGVTAQVIPASSLLPFGAFEHLQLLDFGFKGYPVSPSTATNSVSVFSAAAMQADNATAAGRALTPLHQILTQHPVLGPTIVPAGGADLSEALPVDPLVYAAPMFATKVGYLDFLSGSGVRYLTYFAQNYVPVHADQLIYVYQGLTRDGQYYVSVSFAIKANVSVAPPPDPSNMSAAAAYNQQLADQLQQLSADQFTPNLTTLDALADSITVSPTSSLAAALAVQP